MNISVNTQSNQAVCSGYGVNDTNPTTIDLDEIVELVASPQQCDKEQARWIIPSTYPSRSFAAQRQHGRFWMLVADIDHGSPTLDQVCAAVSPHVGEFVVYATVSATEAEPRWRVLVPLADIAASGEYGAA